MRVAEVFEQANQPSMSKELMLLLGLEGCWHSNLHALPPSMSWKVWLGWAILQGSSLIATKIAAEHQRTFIEAITQVKHRYGISFIIAGQASLLQETVFTHLGILENGRFEWQGAIGAQDAKSPLVFKFSKSWMHLAKWAVSRMGIKAEVINADSLRAWPNNEASTANLNRQLNMYGIDVCEICAEQAYLERTLGQYLLQRATTPKTMPVRI
jgi:hypothetical protein